MADGDSERWADRCPECAREVGHDSACISKGCADLQRIGEELATLLAELSAAARDCANHTKRHPRTNPMESGYWAAADPVAAKADWHRAWTRKEKAMEAVVRYACERYGK